MEKKEILNTLRENVCVFTFTKQTGEVRQALGTLNMKFIPEEKMPKGLKKNVNNSEDSDLITYYDLDRSNWRSFHSSSLINLSVR